MLKIAQYEWLIFKGLEKFFFPIQYTKVLVSDWKAHVPLEEIDQSVRCFT